MATITTLATADNGATSRTTINDNFTNLNTDKAELASPTFTGTPAAPTQTAGDNSTAIATTAYVDAVVVSATAGVSAGPSSSSTQTITHGLSKTPSIIRITGYGDIQNSGSSQSGGSTTGLYSSSGNSCVYLPAATSNAESLVATSVVYAAYLSGLHDESTERHASGVIGNITATDFDIVWTASADVSLITAFNWEAQ